MFLRGFERTAVVAAVTRSLLQNHSALPAAEAYAAAVVAAVGVAAAVAVVSGFPDDDAGSSPAAPRAFS